MHSEAYAIEMIGDIHFLSKTIQCICNHKLNGHTNFMYFWYALCFKWPQIKWWPSGHYHNSQYLMMSSNYLSNLSISIRIILSHFVGAHTFPGGLAIVVRTYLRFITPARHDDVIKWMTPLALCAGKSSVTGEFPSQRPVTRGFDFFFDLRLNKRWSKQSRRRWFETQSRSLCRHGNVLV